MSAVDIAVARLKVDEGFRPKIYRDTMGKATIGYGFNLDAGITPAAAAALMTAQAQEIADTLKTFWWASALDDARLSVVIELAFNLGTHGLLHFVTMLAFLGNKQWDNAAKALLKSQAAQQLPQRYQRMAQILQSGVLQ